MLRKLGILDFNPIQYHTPLYQRLEARGNVELNVLFLSDRGYRIATDRGFGVAIAWDIDLLSGYTYEFLTTADRPTRIADQALTLIRWLRKNDAVVIYGYSNRWMLFAITMCRSLRIPYFIRGDSRPESQSTGIRRHIRRLGASAIVSASCGGLAIGQLNAQFYRKHGARKVIFSPYSVDDERFGCEPELGRSDLLSRWGLPDHRPVIIYCGKLYPGKRPLDLIAAVDLLSQEVTTIFVGDGVLADQIRSLLRPGSGVVTGFVNQSDLPSYYHAADILVLPSEAEKWGLVVNEAMAAGTFPVVSDRVGAAPDLVEGVGEVYPCGDISGLATALSRGLAAIREPQTRLRMRRHADRYSLNNTAIGFEQAAHAVSKRC